jgi:hypothetical protein
VGGFNIEMILKEIGWEDMKVFDLAEDSSRWQAVVIMVMKLGVP